MVRRRHTSWENTYTCLFVNMQGHILANKSAKVQYSVLVGIGGFLESDHIIQASTMAMFHFGFVLKRWLYFNFVYIWKVYDLRSHIENRKILPVSIWVEAIWSHKKMCQSYENKKNFSKIASHKKAVKPYAFLLVFIWLHMTWDQRYCLWKELPVS